MLHFFPCHYCASLPRRDGGVGRYSRSALPIPSPPGLPQHEGDSGAALASCCSYRSLGAALGFHSGKSAVFQGGFPHLELPLPMMVPTAGSPYNGKL